LAAIVVVGIGWGQAGNAVAVTEHVAKDRWFASTMILVLWAYAGWNEAAYIVAEVKNGRRNIPLALILGTTSVIVIYLSINLAFLLALGFEGAKGDAVPAQVLELAWGGYAGNAISVLIIVSSLGAINGMIFTTARIYAEFGTDHRFFEPFSKWSRRWGTPVRALVTQAVITLGLLVGVSAWVSISSQDDAGLPALAGSTVGISGSSFGQGPALGAAVLSQRIGITPRRIADGFDEMIYMTAAVFWLFFLLTGIALFVLRAKDPERPRPFRVPGYPVVPLLFCMSCAYMVYGAIADKPGESLIGLGILMLGVVFYFLPKRMEHRPAPQPEPQVPAGAC
jgi:amino acid transporter